MISDLSKTTSDVCLKQQLFNKIVNYLSIQGIYSCTLFDPVNKAMCAIGYLYADLYSTKKLRKLVINEYKAGNTSKMALKKVINKLTEKYPGISMLFFMDLMNMHDNVVVYKNLTLDISAKSFARNWNLHYDPEPTIRTMPKLVPPLTKPINNIDSPLDKYLLAS